MCFVFGVSVSCQGNLDKASPNAGYVLLMFYHLYEGKVWDYITCLKILSISYSLDALEHKTFSIHLKCEKHLLIVFFCTQELYNMYILCCCTSLLDYSKVINILVMTVFFLHLFIHLEIPHLWLTLLPLLSFSLSPSLLCTK